MEDIKQSLSNPPEQTTKGTPTTNRNVGLRREDITIGDSLGIGHYDE